MDTMLTNRLGICKSSIMVQFLVFIESPSTETLKETVSFITKHIKRAVTLQESIAMIDLVLEYSQSEPGTNERNVCMNKLFDFEFLNPTNNDKSGI